MNNFNIPANRPNDVRWLQEEIERLLKDRAALWGMIGKIKKYLAENFGKDCLSDEEAIDWLIEDHEFLQKDNNALNSLLNGLDYE